MTPQEKLEALQKIGAMPKDRINMGELREAFVEAIKNDRKIKQPFV